MALPPSKVCRSRTTRDRRHTTDLDASPHVRRTARIGWLGLVAVAVCAVFTSRPADAAQSEDRSPLGINVARVGSWTSQIAFKDLFRQSSRWYPQLVDSYTWDTGAALDLDQYGWVRSLAPGQAAGVLLAHDLDARYEGGLYTLRYDGEGTLMVLLDGQVLQDQPGEMQVWVTPSDTGIHVKLVATNPANPLRNIRLIAPGHANDDLWAEPFLPLFLEQLEPFGVIRFMQWQRTNDSPTVHWSERVTPRHASQGLEGGVALEYMITLCNQLDADAWLCAPHLATDSYVNSMAKLVRRLLEPERKVYVEYSNEVWNETYEQANHAQMMGLSQGLSTNEVEAGLRFYAERSVEVFDVWHERFSSETERVVRVLAGHHANPWTATTVLSWNRAYEFADCYATAPYFGISFGLPENQWQTLGWSIDQLLDQLEQDVDSVLSRVAENAAIADALGLPLVAYEGGQHLVGVGSAVDNDALADLFIAANRHPRMGAIYRTALEGWRQHGGQRYLPWNSVGKPSRWGSWGLLENMTHDPSQAPKYSAVIEFIKNNPSWW